MIQAPSAMVQTYQRILLCGSREWDDYLLVAERLDLLWNAAALLHLPLTIIEGGARGADACAARWAIEHPAWGSADLHHEQYKADWLTYGRAAGPRRNATMLAEGKPDLVLAFKDGFDDSLKKGGTENMCKIAKAAGVQVVLVSHER